MKMLEDQYQIIPYQSAYRESVLRLLSHLWGSDQQQNESYLQWKYDANPYNHPPVIFLAIKDEQVVGVRSFFPMCLQVGLQARQIACLQDADTVIHPDHQRRGLLTAMSLMVQDDLVKLGYRLIITLSGNQKSTAANLKMGWHPVETLGKWYWQAIPTGGTLKRLGFYDFFQRSIGFIQRRLLKQSKFKADIFSEFDRRFDKVTPASGKVRLIQKPELIRMVELASRCTRLKSFHHIRDRSFYAWRFMNPKSDYRFLVYGDEVLSGYLVLQAQRHGNVQEVALVDWMVESPDILEELITVAKLSAKSIQINTWFTGITEEYRQVLVSAGFCPLIASQAAQEDAYQPVFLVRPLFMSNEEQDWKPEGIDLFDIKNWDLRPIYSDIY